MGTEKLTKVDRLKKALEAAKANLAAREPALLAALAKAKEELDRLRKTHEALDKKTRAAYEAFSTATREESVRLGLTDKTGTTSDKLLAALKTFAEASGCPAANLTSLAREVIARELKNVPRLAELSEAHTTLSKMKDKAYRDYNVAGSFTSPYSRLGSELRELRERVEDLEKEIARVPDRNAKARERREEAREEETMMKDTNKARELLPTFKFEV